MTQGKTYDAFLSHNSEDKSVVEEIGRYLTQKAGLKVFLDKWDLIPGVPWQEELENALTDSVSCVCFIGKHGTGPWQNEEVRAAIAETVADRSIRVVPVLLPGVKRTEKESRLPPFLRRLSWVEFRHGWDEPDNLHRLVCGIKGLPPGMETTAPATANAEEITCPYRGLEVFREEDRRFFFGRDAAVQRLMTRLRDTRFLAVVGPSGVGKSSIVQAGLIPRLRDHSLIAMFTPRTDPIEELAVALHGVCIHDAVPKIPPVEQLYDRLKASPRALHFIAREILQPGNGPGKNSLLLVVDQFEELFTLTPTGGDRREFIALLCGAAEKDPGPVSVILTMRSDFLGKCAFHTGLNVHIIDNLEQIEPMGPGELKSAIEQPARAVGLEFEAGLVKRILDDGGRGTGELPLVEHALLELFKRRENRRLTMAAYTETGGISGALTRRAETEYGKLNDEEKEILRRMFVLRLVQLGEGTEDTRRRVLKEELLPERGNREAAERILKTWSDARLLTVMHDPVRKRDMVDTAHESLIRGWERLRRWMEEDREASRQVGVLRQAVREWEQSGKDHAFLYRDARLALLEELMDSHARDLTETEREFILAGVVQRETEHRKEAERQKELVKAKTRVIRRTRLVLAVIMLALIGTAFFWHQSNQNKKNALRQLAMNYRDNAHLAREKGDSLKALHWLAEAAATTPNSTARKNYLLDMNELWGITKLSLILEHDVNLRGAVFSRDGAKILTWTGHYLSEGGSARLWKAASTEPIGRPMIHKNSVVGAMFNRDETKILTWSEDKTARLWEVGTGKPIGSPMTHEGPVQSAVFNRDETKILTWSSYDTLQLWEVETGKPIGRTMTHHHHVIVPKYNRDRTKILTWNADNSVRLSEVQTGKTIGLPMTHDNIVKGAVFNRDETKILTWSKDNTARLWEAGTGKPVGRPMTHKRPVKNAMFNRDETKILTESDDNTVWLWEAETGNLIGLPMKHEGFVWGAVFNRDETKILTWSNDKTARLWEAGTGKPIVRPMTHDDTVNGAVFNRDETKILTWSGSPRSIVGCARLWETGTGKPIGFPMIHKANVRGAVFNRDEKKILTISGKTVQWWDIDVDYDFPVTLLNLQITAITGTEFDPANGEIRFLEPKRFEKIKARYLEKAAEHYRECRYKDANIYHRFFGKKSSQ